MNPSEVVAVVLESGNREYDPGFPVLRSELCKAAAAGRTATIFGRPTVSKPDVLQMFLRASDGVELYLCTVQAGPDRAGRDFSVKACVAAWIGRRFEMEPPAVLVKLNVAPAPPAIDLGVTPAPPIRTQLVEFPADFIVYRCKISGGHIIELPLPPVLTEQDAYRINQFLRTQIDSGDDLDD